MCKVNLKTKSGRVEGMPLNILDDVNRLYPSTREISLVIERHFSSSKAHESGEASRAIKGSFLIANCSAVLATMFYPACNVSPTSELYAIDLHTIFSQKERVPNEIAN